MVALGLTVFLIVGVLISREASLSKKSPAQQLASELTSALSQAFYGRAGYVNWNVQPIYYGNKYLPAASAFTFILMLTLLVDLIACCLKK